MQERLYNPATEPSRSHHRDPIRCRRVNHVWNEAEIAVRRRANDGKPAER